MLTEKETVGKAIKHETKSDSYCFFFLGLIGFYLFIPNGVDFSDAGLTWDILTMRKIIHKVLPEIRPGIFNHKERKEGRTQDGAMSIHMRTHIVILCGWFLR